MYRADGGIWRNRIQSYDSTFGVDSTDAITLHWLSEGVIPPEPACGGNVQRHEAVLAAGITRLAGWSTKHGSKDSRQAGQYEPLLRGREGASKQLGLSGADQEMEMGPTKRPHFYVDRR